MRNKTLFGIISAILLGGVSALFVYETYFKTPSLTPEQIQDRTLFAQCLTDKKAIMYGSITCPHCTRQKEMFGKEIFAKYVSYVECYSDTSVWVMISKDAQGKVVLTPTQEGTPGAQAITGVTPACLNANISGYPTWVFADGSRIEGEATFESLAQKTGCSLGATLTASGETTKK